MSVEHVQKGGDFYPQAHAAEESGHFLEDVTFFYVRAWIGERDKIFTLLGEDIKARVPVVMTEVLTISYCNVLKLSENTSRVKVSPEELSTNGNIPTYKAKL